MLGKFLSRSTEGKVICNRWSNFVRVRFASVPKSVVHPGDFRKSNSGWHLESLSAQYRLLGLGRSISGFPGLSHSLGKRLIWFIWHFAGYMLKLWHWQHLLGVLWWSITTISRERKQSGMRSISRLSVLRLNSAKLGEGFFLSHRDITLLCEHPSFATVFQHDLLRIMCCRSVADHVL